MDSESVGQVCFSNGWPPDIPVEIRMAKRRAPWAGEDESVIVRHMGTDVPTEHVGDELRHVDPTFRLAGFRLAEVKDPVDLGE